MHYLRLLLAPRTFVLFVDVLLCSLVAAAPRFDPLVLVVDAAVLDGVADAVVAAIDGIVVVGVVVTAEFPLLFADIPLLINTDGATV